MKLFLIGPISHGGQLPLEQVRINVARFEHYTERLTHFGYDCIHEAINRETEEDRVTWEAAMKRSILRMLSCDGVYLLPGWQRSRGARLEVFVAGEVGIPIIDTPLETSTEQMGRTEPHNEAMDL